MWKRKKPAAPTREPFVLEELEPRIFFSAGVEGVLLDTDELDEMEKLLDEVPAVEFVLPTLEEATPVEAAETQPRELVVVDTGTPDFQRLVDDILAQAGEGRQIEVAYLDAFDDGITELGEMLAGYTDLDAVHLISHASDGAVSLGGSTLNFDTLLNRSTSIKNWSNAFTEEGDLLIYGCNLAASADGQAMVDALSRLTGADVAASDDLTGHESLGGDWELEYQAGDIETDIALAPDAKQAWQGVLATVSDDFSSGGFSGGSGWVGDWIEVDGAGAGAASGNVIVTSGEISMRAAGSSVAREVDLSSATSATLTFDYRTGAGIEAVDPDSLVVEVSGDGGSTWNTLEDINYLDGVNSGSKIYMITPKPQQA